MEVKEALIAARKLIEKPEHWTKGVLARDSYGHPTTMKGDNAVCWCMSGAIGRACGGYTYTWDRGLMTLMDHFADSDTVTVTEFNDAEERTHAEVLAAFDRAIAAA